MPKDNGPEACRLTIILRDNSGTAIGDGYIPITSLTEHKSNRTIILYNLGIRPSGSTAQDGHFFYDHFFYVHFYVSGSAIVIPSGKNYSIQNLGLKSTVYSIKGSIVATGSLSLVNGRSILRGLIGKTGSIESGFISRTPIYYESITFNDKDIPSEVKFTLKSIEIK